MIERWLTTKNALAVSVGMVAFLLCVTPGRSTVTDTPLKPDSVGRNAEWWAQKTGLLEGDIRRLRTEAGVEEGQTSGWIESIDAKTLPKGHVLVVTANGDGRCIQVGVYRRRFVGFKQVWYVSGMPGGGGFCHSAPCRKPGAFATKKGEVVIAVPPPHETPNGVCDENVLLTYRRTGKSYEFVDQQRTPTPCGIDTYHQALNAAFGTFEKDRLATIQILPSFNVESAIALDRIGNGITVTRIKLRRQLWSELGMFIKRQKPSECIDTALKMEKTWTPLPISSREAENFVAELQKISLRKDECPRARDGSCILTFDGTSSGTFVLDLCIA